MSLRAIRAALAGLIALLPTAPADAGTVFQYRLTVEAAERRVLVYVPEELPPGPRPLVLVLHGGAGTDRSVMRITRRRFETLADRDGWLVAYPNATDGIWRFAADPINAAFGLSGDDLSYFDAVLETIGARHAVDPARIFATGISRGGQASYHLACNRPGTIAAIAPVAMPLPAFMEDPCRAAPRFGVMVMNGTADPLVPFEGGPIRVGRRVRADVLPTAETLALFAAKNGCAGPGPVTVTDRLDDGMRALARDWTGCAAPVREVTIEDGGHTWPGGRQYLPKLVIGPVTDEIDGMEEVWRFFRRF